jgi:hypothetical protein
MIFVISDIELYRRDNCPACFCFRQSGRSLDFWCGKPSAAMFDVTTEDLDIKSA